MSSISGGHVLGGLKLDKLVTPERLEKHRVPERLAAEQPATSALAPLLDEAPKEGSWRRLGAILEESCKETDEGIAVHSAGQEIDGSSGDARKEEIQTGEKSLRKLKIKKKAPGGPPPPPPPPPPAWHDAGPSSSSTVTLPHQASRARPSTTAPFDYRAPQPTPYGYTPAPLASFGGTQPYFSTFAPPPFQNNQHGANQVPLGIGRSGQGGGWLQAGGRGGQGTWQGAPGGSAGPSMPTGARSVQTFDSAYIDSILNNEIDYEEMSSFIKSASTTDAEGIAQVVAPKALELATHGPGFFLLLDLFDKNSKKIDESLALALGGHCVDLLKSERGERSVRHLLRSRNLSSKIAASLRRELFEELDTLAESFEANKLLRLAIHRAERQELFDVFERIANFFKGSAMSDVLKHEDFAELLNASFDRLLELDKDEGTENGGRTDTVRALATSILSASETWKDNGPALHLVKHVIQTSTVEQLHVVTKFFDGRIRTYACTSSPRKHALEAHILCCSADDVEMMIEEVLETTEDRREKLRVMLEDENGVWVVRAFLVAGSHRNGPNYQQLVERTRYLLPRVQTTSLAEKRLRAWA
ncbi:hypothetical protein OF846_000756 [Rhodotorula toruloides]|nr:hypothetical protein OF846_000756 [Rhodotorula toruloides]